MLEVGIKGQVEYIVDEKSTAKAMGSGTLDVLATPWMIALIEKAACESVQPYLDDLSGTVGTLVNVTHDSATPVGMKVTCKTELTYVSGRRLTFKVEAFDELGPIGSGIHERFVIFNDKFQEKADKKFLKKEYLESKNQ